MKRKTISVNLKESEMSYDISLCDPVSGETLHAASVHQMSGGTYCLGGTTALELNVTYNYGHHYRRIFGEKGIRTLYGKSGAESSILLEAAIMQLSDDTDTNYWTPAEGNAKRALKQLLAMAQMRPDGVWEGD
jgi:hypothetical protein